MDVDAAGISGKVSAQYPGRSQRLPCTRLPALKDAGKATEKSAEAIVGG